MTVTFYSQFILTLNILKLVLNKVELKSCEGKNENKQF